MENSCIPDLKKNSFFKFLFQILLSRKTFHSRKIVGSDQFQLSGVPLELFSFKFYQLKLMKPVATNSSRHWMWSVFGENMCLRIRSKNDLFNFVQTMILFVSDLQKLKFFIFFHPHFFALEVQLGINLSKN